MVRVLPEAARAFPAGPDAAASFVDRARVRRMLALLNREDMPSLEEIRAQ
jgi:hypothetical protein